MPHIPKKLLVALMKVHDFDPNDKSVLDLAEDKATRDHLNHLLRCKTCQSLYDEIEKRLGILTDDFLFRQGATQIKTPSQQAKG